MGNIFTGGPEVKKFILGRHFETILITKTTLVVAVLVKSNPFFDTFLTLFDQNPTGKKFLLWQIISKFCKLF